MPWHVKHTDADRGVKLPTLALSVCSWRERHWKERQGTDGVVVSVLAPASSNGSDGTVQHSQSAVSLLVWTQEHQALRYRQAGRCEDPSILPSRHLAHSWGRTKLESFVPSCQLQKYSTWIVDMDVDVDVGAGAVCGSLLRITSCRTTVIALAMPCHVMPCPDSCRKPQR